MSGPFLYSTNPFIKLLIQERYRNDEHYVWCAESFDANKQPGFTAASLVAASSNPASIYKELRMGCQKGEKHCSKIKEVRASLKALAVAWEAAGEITEDDKQEIILLADDPDPMYWQPLIYVIHKERVQDRLENVPLVSRASWGKEFVLKNMKRTEFDIITVD
ncbi:MAG TPA: hypothetical protein VK149_06105 [Sideroxyarcus sp.]|nr:hypothetical protein [Sideroxyarcus sp.]